MSRCTKIEDAARRSASNVPFADAVKLAECYGFVHARTAGSHHLYRHPAFPDQLNFQPAKDGKAKPYQIRQLLDFIDEHPEAGG